MLKCKLSGLQLAVQAVIKKKKFLNLCMVYYQFLQSTVFTSDANVKLCMVLSDQKIYIQYM